ncbi:hypothetical protein SELMODRAFT_415091 [Selaginella moellendorffii]|uniref:4-coumarate--CoA ligase n=2 Tax=Selaginella moellendorffii TaxID=88036 RepID=D8RUZ8_SELML|nr:hypothetical protein SELMODRAFT_415091 [Selaginella moellendorffii]
MKYPIPTGSLGTLKRIFYGGDAFPERQEIESHLAPVRLVQQYGMTECGQISMGTTANAGYLLPGIEAKVEFNGVKLYPGEQGRLWVRGDGVVTTVRGKDRFADTGDIGFFDSDNRLHLVGREKDITKCPGVREVAVVGKPERTYGHVPVAFVVMDPPRDANAIIAFVGKLAPEWYMPIHDVIFVPELPRTPITAKVIAYTVENHTKCKGKRN